MKITPLHISLIILLVLSFTIASILYRSYHHDNIFAIFAYLIFGIAWAVCFMIVWKNSGWVMRIASILTMTPIALIYFYYQGKIDQPSLLKAQRHGLYADFKKDGTYVIKSGAWASKVHLYGRYDLQDSIIKIDTCCIDDVISSHRLVIRDTDLNQERLSARSDALSTERYMVFIDESGKEINNGVMFKDSGSYKVSYRFEVIYDDRSADMK